VCAIGVKAGWRSSLAGERTSALLQVAVGPSMSEARVSPAAAMPARLHRYDGRFEMTRNGSHNRFGSALKCSLHSCVAFLALILGRYLPSLIDARLVKVIGQRLPVASELSTTF
jgi:hypothetical protein